MSEIERFDVLVFGSGAGGKITAWTSASEGLRTAVVERGLIGGSCPNIACLPTKNVIHSSKVADFVRHDRDFGSCTAPASIEMAEVRLANGGWWMALSACTWTNARQAVPNWSLERAASLDRRRFKFDETMAACAPCRATACS
jgi:hypothetical protein